MKQTAKPITWPSVFSVLILALSTTVQARNTSYLENQVREARTAEEAAKTKAAELHRQIEAATVKAQQLRTATKNLTKDLQAQKKVLDSAKSDLSKINAAKQSEVEKKLAEAKTLEQMIKSQMPGVTLGGGAEAEEVWKKINDKYYTNFMNPKVFGLQKEVEEATHSLRTMLDKMAEIPLTRKEEGIAIDNEYVKVRDEKIPGLQKKLDAAIEECRKQVRDDMSALSAKEAEIGKADPDASVKNAIEKVREAEAKNKELEKKVLEASVAEANADRGPMDDFKKAVAAYADATSLRQSREKELAQARAEAAAAAKTTQSPSNTIPTEDASSDTASTLSRSPAASGEVIVPDLSVFNGLTEMQAVARHAGLVPVLAATKATPPPGKTLFATQDPLPGTKAAKGSVLKIIVYQKAAQTTSSSNAGGDLEGEWEGMIGAGKDKQKASFTISREDGDYFVSMPGQKATRGKMENGVLVMEGVLDFSGVAPFSFGGPPAQSKDSDPARLKIFFSATDDDLTIDVTVTTRKEGEKKAHLGTIHRKKAG